jgi:retron-type reverse transcriptase
MKTGYVHFGGLSDSDLANTIGTPQGSILSPLLCNILLSPLDEYVEGLIKEISNDKSIVKSQEYRNAVDRAPKGTPWANISDSIKDIVKSQVGIKDIRRALKPIRVKAAIQSEIP